MIRGSTPIRAWQLAHLIADGRIPRDAAIPIRSLDADRVLDGLDSGDSKDERHIELAGARGHLHPTEKRVS